MATRWLVTALLLANLGGVVPAEAAQVAPPPRAQAPAGAAPKVAVALISEAAGIEPGAALWVGLRQRIAPGWHTYWLNPGDSGEPPTIDWALPAGWRAGPIVWPLPERVPVGPLMSCGYSTRKAAPTAVLLDATGVVGRQYGATNTPHMYVLDRAGRLVYAGAIDDRPTSRRADVQGANNYVRAALEAVAAGQPVKTPVTRAYGCTVKYP
jgi:hypothetical protein